MRFDPIAGREELPPYEIRWHESAASIYETFLRGLLADAGENPDEFAEMIQESESGFNVTFSDAVSGMEMMGLWGFSVTTTNEIHLWRGRKSSRAELAHLVAHELWHICEAWEAKESARLGHDSGRREESRCEMAGRLIGTVNQIVKMAPTHGARARRLTATQSETIHA